MTEQVSDLKSIIEAAVLVADSPLSIDRMIAMFTEGAQPSREVVKEALKALEADYADRGIELKCIDKGYRIQSREAYSPWIKKLLETRPPRYSRALLETLAIIAYRQPVTRGEIEEIRGVAVSTDIIRTLLGREWIRQVGHRDIPGKPALFGTTKGFLEHFNLKSLSELPELPELRDTESISRELNLSLSLEEPPQGDDAAAAEGVGPTAASGA